MRNYGYDEEGYKKSLSDKVLWKRILTLVAHHKIHLVGAIFLSFFITGTTLLLPQLIQRGIDNFMLPESLGTLERFAGIHNIATLYGICILIFFVAGFLQILLLEWVGQAVMHTIRQNLFAKILGLDLSFFSEHQSGGLVTRLTNDIQNMHEMFTSVIVNLFNDSLRLIGILSILIYMNIRLGLTMGLFLPLALATTIFFSRLAREKFRKMRSGVSQINTFLSEIIAGVSTVQLFGRQKTMLRHFTNINNNYLNYSIGQVRIFALFMPLTEFMSSFAVALILWYGGGQVLQDKLSLGELVAFLSYMRLFFQPLRELSQKYSIVQSAMASAERIFTLMDTTQDIHDKETTTAIDHKNVEGEICFSAIDFGYSQDQKILHNIDLCVKKGETLALVGTTGSGKTTLINLLLRFYEPQQGSITIDGVNILDYAQKDLRSLVGVILQDIILLQDTLLANITMNTGRTRAEVEQILTDTGMNRFVSRLPQGLDTIIGQGGQELSTGEKQLLSFARVLCRKPSIIVLDEATAAIDTESENILEEAIAKCFEGKTSIVIAHRLSTIRRADRIVVMHQGEIVEQGSHDELIEKKQRYFELISMDQENLSS